MSITMLNQDCMEYMAGLPDNAFDLAIVDPPYGIGAAQMTFGKWRTSRMAGKTWDDSAPPPCYFEELMRVSERQIVFGGNYFNLPPSRCFVVWDKGQGFKGRDFAEAELAWCSFDANATIFRYDPLAAGDYKGKIHPTQKPVAIYKYLLTKYAKPGWKILDTHGGSGSLCIACHDIGFGLTWMELEPDYYEAAVKRYQEHARQGSLFAPSQLPSPVQKPLFEES